MDVLPSGNLNVYSVMYQSEYEQWWKNYSYLLLKQNDHYMNVKILQYK